MELIFRTSAILQYFNQTLKIIIYTANNICVRKGFCMLKNNVFTKTVSLTVIGSFVLALAPEKSRAQMLIPVSFSQMYYLAQNGEVEALRGSVRRGMNIDVMNQNGDTGLCIAAKRGDSYTYNAFRAAGANPRHPCTQNVPNYEDFIHSARTTPIGSTSRAAYSMMGKEAYSVSPWVYWTAGALAVGAGAGIALSGGGGGGGVGDTPTPAPVVNKIDSVAKNLASNGQILLSAGYNENKTNSADRSMTNSNTSIYNLDFNKDVTKSGEELNVILNAENGGTYTNNTGTDLTAKSGVAAMAAYKNSTISNSGALKVSGYNAALGMLAGQNSYAFNDGSGANGIYLTFKGFRKDDTIIGMYADSGSTIRNNGLIKGTAALITDEQDETQTSTGTTATKGSMVGMEVMIVNANTDSSSTITRAINDSTIDLVAGQDSTGSDLSIEVSIVGMGTYLDEGFLSDNKNINRAEKAEITNNGDINLSYVGKYSSAGDYIKNGIGGIVGMKADANGTATNKSNINITMSSTDSTSAGSGSGSGSATNYAVAAGMQSVHGGKIVNSSTGTITATVSAADSRISYGMIAVKGSGDVSGLYTISPTVTNEGTIKMQISNGYGMASYAGGTLSNNNKIILGVENDNDYSNNIGMYTDTASIIENSGTITIYAKDSVAIQNDYSGGVTITNDGTITINRKATGSHPFAGNYSNIINNGIIDYQASESSGSTPSFPDGFTFSLTNAVVNTNGENTLTSGSSSSSSTPSTSSTNLTKDITNNNTIRLTGSSYTAAIATDSDYGTVLNNGIIELNKRTGYNTYQSVGIYSTSAVGIDSAVKNMGTIIVNTEYSGGIVSDATTEGVIITNGKYGIIADENGKIVVNGNNSVGMFASGTASIYNYGTIRVGGANSYAIIASGAGTGAAQQIIRNDGIIELAASGATAFYVGKDSTAVIEKSGIIKVIADDVVGYRIDNDTTITEIPNIAEDETYLKTFIYYDVGGGTLTISLTDDSEHVILSTFARALSGGAVVNNSNFATGDEGTVLFKGLSGSNITNNGTLTAKYLNSYAIKSSGTVENGSDGKIYVTSPAAYGIYVNTSMGSANNKGTINISGNATDSNVGGYGMYASNNASLNNNGTITVSGNGKDKSGGVLSSGPFGMYADINSEAVNSKIINVNGYDAHGMWASSDSTITNDENGKIYVNNSDNKSAYGMVAGANNSTANNLGEVFAQSQNSKAMYTQTATLNNSKTITVASNAYGMYTKGSSASATNSGTVNAAGTEAYGMYAESGASLTNSAATGSGSSATSAGTIEVNGASAYGMYATDTNTLATNGGIINVSINEAYGIYGSNGAKIVTTAGSGSGSSAISGGTINVIGANSSGIFATGKDSYNTSTNVASAGTINISGQSSIGIEASSSASATNSGTISATGKDTYGMYADSGASITNSAATGSGSSATSAGTIDVSGTSAYGMYATDTNTLATNGGTINVSTDDAYGMLAENGAQATNDTGATLNIESANAYGMYATDTNTLATNGGIINVSVDEAYGMYAENGAKIVTTASSGSGSSAISGGTINVVGANSSGIFATGKDTYNTSTNVASAGTISISGESSIGINASSSASATNSGTINATGKYTYGMYATDTNTLATNGGTINVSADDANGMYAENGAEATNSNGAIINVEGANAYGMYADANSSVTNNGTIEIKNISSKSCGMIGIGSNTNGSAIENYKNINVSGTEAVGIYIKNNGEAINRDGATLNVFGTDAYGMYATGSNATAINEEEATINVDGEEATGMFAEDGGSVVNYGTINVNHNNAYGMYATGNGSEATNEADINVTGYSSVGMFAENGATVINNGSIYATGNDSYGMYIRGGNYNNDNGTIVTSGSAHDIYEEPTAAAPSFTMSAPKFTLMSATNSGKIINNGIISTNSALDFGDLTDNSGSISVGNGGSYIAPSFSGNVVADSNITFNGFENEYINENSFVGEDNGLNITSGSYLFDVQKSLNENGNTDVIMTKKDFADVVENSSLAEFLEENYAEKNNESLYVALKSTENSAQFEQNLNSLFGQDLLSDLTFEDLNMLRELQFDMNNKMFSQEKGSFALADGIEAVKGEKFGSTGQYALSGYNDGTTTVAVGLSVADVKSSANKNTKNGKLNKNIMLSMPISRKAGGFELITSPKLGFARGSYEREGLNGENYNGTVERKTFALMNEARYPLKINGLKVIPSAEFNMIGYNIKAREDKKQYSLNVDSQNHYSVESGLGLNLEKEFAPYTDSKIKLSGGIAVYKEFADPYELKVGMNEMNGSYKLKDESRGDKRTVLRFGAGYNLKENIDISAMIRTNIDREYRTDTGINLNYHF